MDTSETQKEQVKGLRPKKTKDEEDDDNLVSLKELAKSDPKQYGGVVGLLGNLNRDRPGLDGRVNNPNFGKDVNLPYEGSYPQRVKSMLTARDYYDNEEKKQKKVKGLK